MQGELLLSNNLMQGYQEIPRANVTQGRIQSVRLTDRLPKCENSKMAWNYSELITRMYRIDVKASHYKINPPMHITCTDWADRQTGFFSTFLNKKKLHKKIPGKF